ncbi:protein shisa-4-like [Paramacrobiotus metropolitanus]|uniref:protein shisa-4-like n=1 Tax=Paramacrobiotus metropolitanus TaxID=2943436 RepID=UPI002445AF2D|nr:protein shisa-4-like [Paramacrobiotus metropolitanus]
MSDEEDAGNTNDNNEDAGATNDNQGDTFRQPDSDFAYATLAHPVTQSMDEMESNVHTAFIAWWIILLIVLAITVLIPLIIVCIVCYRRKKHGTVQGVVVSGAPGAYPVGQAATVTYPPAPYPYPAYGYPATGAPPTAPQSPQSPQPTPPDPAAAAPPAPPPTARKTQ